LNVHSHFSSFRPGVWTPGMETVYILNLFPPSPGFLRDIRPLSGVQGRRPCYAYFVSNIMPS